MLKAAKNMRGKLALLYRVTGRPGHRLHIFLNSTYEPQNLPPRCYLPQAGTLIALNCKTGIEVSASSERVAAIWREGDGKDPVGMSFQTVQRAPRRSVPRTGGFVCAASKHIATVRREGNRKHPSRVSFESASFLS